METIKNKKLQSISVKLIFLLSLSAMVALTLSTIAIIVNTYNSAKKEYVVSLENITNILIQNLAASVEFDDVVSAKSFLKTLKNDPNIEGAFIFKGDDKLFGSFVNKKEEEEELIEKLNLVYSFYDLKEKIEYTDKGHIFISMPIKVADEYVATFCIVANTKELNENVIEQIKVEFFVSIVVLFISILMALRLQRVFTRPILELKTAMQDVGKSKNLNISVENKYNDEFAILFDGFNSMLKKINQQNIELENYTDTLNKTINEKTKDLNIKNMQLENLMLSFNRNIIFHVRISKVSSQR